MQSNSLYANGYGVTLNSRSRLKPREQKVKCNAEDQHDQQINQESASLNLLGQT
jgi:hypothetical protein